MIPRRLPPGRVTYVAWLAALALLLAACGDEERPVTSPLADAEPPLEVTAADVIDVSTSGQPGAYSFSVTVSSPDTGCEQYADWWEVVTEDGQLLYRRVLLHSHVAEQPFTRSGGPVDVTAETRHVEGLQQYLFTPGDGRLIEALAGDDNCAFATFEEIASPGATETIHWSFTVN